MRYGLVSRISRLFSGEGMDLPCRAQNCLEIIVVFKNVNFNYESKRRGRSVQSTELHAKPRTAADND